LVVLAGAFPKDLGHLEKNNHHDIPRTDWLNWIEHADSDAARIAAFGDYSVLHGHFEDQEGQFRNFSASIRYTLSDHWLIMKGEGVYNEDGAGFAQWPAHAKILTSMSEFAGEAFSPGDKFISEMARDPVKKGNVAQWLSAAISHHMTAVVTQIALRTAAPIASS
jgi:hypothetical protein